MKIKLSDRPKKPYPPEYLKKYPFLKDTFAHKKWELSRSILKLKISYLKIFRDLFKKKRITHAKTKGNKVVESRIIKTYIGKAEVEIHETEQLNPEAKLASSMVERWGMVTGLPDGEDSSGRAKLKIMPVNEMVERAFEAAALIMKKAREKKLTHNTPTYAEIEKFEKKNK